MDLQDIREALAGVCVATLISGACLGLTGCASGGSGQPGAGGADVQKKEAGKFEERDPFCFMP